MASALYPLGKQAILAGDIHFDTDTIKIVPLNTTTDYTYSTAHDFLNDVTTYTGATAQTLSNKTIALGVFDNTATVTFTALAIDGTKDVEAFLVYRDSGVAATSEVIAYLEVTAITPNGTDLVVTVHASGIFAI